MKFKIKCFTLSIVSKQLYELDQGSRRNYLVVVVVVVVAQLIEWLPPQYQRSVFRIQPLANFNQTFVFLKKGAILGLFFRLFSSFQKDITILTTNICEIILCPSSIQRWDSNPQPLEHECPPITTRPGLGSRPSNICLLLTMLKKRKYRKRGRDWPNF